tara:strand:- start:319 stop:1449 length:1131 start_codon:yes stop_codon:yes gene_type:complete
MKTFKTFIKEAKMAPKINANRGDVAEIILGAAVTAKFLHPPQTNSGKISRKNVEDILKSVLKSKSLTTTRPDKLAGTVKISDNIKFKVGVPKKAWEFISDTNNWKLVDDLFDSSLAYANGERRLRSQAFNMYANNKKDDIFVNSDGTGDQKGTKADIKLLINGRKAPQQISLKVAGGEQFGQVAGITFDKQIEIWGRLGVDVKSAEKAFNKKMGKVTSKMMFADRNTVGMKEVEVAIRGAFGESYKYAAKQLQSKLPIDKLSFFLKTAATKGEKEIELVKLIGRKYKRAKFGRQFEKNLKEILPKLTIEFEQTTDAIVHIYDKTRGPKSSLAARLIRVRGFFQRPSTMVGGDKKFYGYGRNIIEAGDILFEIATDR